MLCRAEHYLNLIPLQASLIPCHPILFYSPVKWLDRSENEPCHRTLMLLIMSFPSRMFSPWGLGNYPSTLILSIAMMKKQSHLFFFIVPMQSASFLLCTYHVLSWLVMWLVSLSGQKPLQGRPQVLITFIDSCMASCLDSIEAQSIGCSTTKYLSRLTYKVEYVSLILCSFLHHKSCLLRIKRYFLFPSKVLNWTKPF